MEDLSKQDSNKQLIPDAPKRPVDASIELLITEDQQIVYAEIKPPQYEGRNLSQSEIMASLIKHHVIAGIKADIVTNMAISPVYGTKFIVAQGTLPTEGTDALLEYHFSINKEFRPRERADGTVDYRDMGLMLSVKAGDKLCTLTPAVKGTLGKTVTGKLLLAQPIKKLNLPVGKNTKASDDKCLLFATITGCIEVQGGKVNVLDIFAVNGNVDASTGNIKFDGTVTVNGDVMTGYSIRATGKIEVYGIVEGATIEAGSDVKINAGLICHGSVSCGGNFTTRFIENSSVVAKGNVNADSVIHSQIKCGGSLVVDGRHGVIVGGECVVGKDIRALTIGSPSSIATMLELGIDPTINSRMKAIEVRIRQLKKELERLSQIINLLAPLASANRLPAEKIDLLNKAVLTKSAYEAEQELLKTEYTALDQALENIMSSQVVCRKDLFTGVKINIGHMAYVVSTSLVQCRIYVSTEQEIAVGTIT